MFCSVFPQKKNQYHIAFCLIMRLQCILDACIFLLINNVKVFFRLYFLGSFYEFIH